MLSRARHGMIILGSADTIRRRVVGSPNMFQKILDILEEDKLIGDKKITLKCQMHGNLTEITKPEDFSARAPDGKLKFETIFFSLLFRWLYSSLQWEAFLWTRL